MALEASLRANLHKYSGVLSKLSNLTGGHRSQLTTLSAHFRLHPHLDLKSRVDAFHITSAGFRNVCSRVISYSIF